MDSWKKAMQAVGFNGFVEVALGGDMTAAYEADEWLEAYEAGEKKVTSCCPGFVNMVRKHYPDLADKISTTVSPMCAVSRMIKAKDPAAGATIAYTCLFSDLIASITSTMYVFDPIAPNGQLEEGYAGSWLQWFC